MITDLANIGTFLASLAALFTVLVLWYERRATIVFNIEIVNYNFCLTIENIGKLPARNVRVQIPEELISSLPEDGELHGARIKEFLYDLNNRKLHLSSGSKMYFWLIHCEREYAHTDFLKHCNEWHQKFGAKQFRFRATYNWIYRTSDKFSISQFSPYALEVKTPQQEIADNINSLTKEITKCKDALNSIRKQLNNNG